MPPVTPFNPDYLGFLYAAAVAGGGIAGYAKRKSAVSLGMGVLFGTMIAAGSYLTSVDPQNVAVSALASGVLTGVMGSRFFKSRKFMPAGMVFVMSLLMLGRYLWRLRTYF